MNYLLAISSPVGGSMTCAYMYPACEIIVGDTHLYIDLLSLNIDHFDVILGMDWLMKYHATIDCVAKQVVFRPPGLPEFMFNEVGVVPPPYLISSMKAFKLIKMGCKGYLCWRIDRTY